MATLVAAGGWAYEDGRMKRQAEEGHHEGPRNARFTQVVTFSIAEGQYEAATAEDGVIERIEDSDNELRDLAGFQDLRIIASPSESGPSQVLVETTWADREGLATYDETRQTVLDILNEFPEQVVPGSVQVFDMVVVRDTKDMSVRFATGTAATLIGSLAVGGLLVGAGLTMFQGEGGGGGEGDGDTEPQGFAGNRDGRRPQRRPGSQETITLPPNTEVTIGSGQPRTPAYPAQRRGPRRRHAGR
ncbi:MAG: hypothetical protein U5Q44_09015 [Dehalococcoidia bacterium]|nr:hypothetical protein [Dehalococcoidia bacterium]